MPAGTDALFERGYADLEKLIRGSWRTSLIDQASAEPSLGRALARLRAGMQTHRWSHPGGVADLGPSIRDLDQATREDGLHVLHDWDGKAGRVTPNSIAVDVVDFVSERRGDESVDRPTLAIAFDYYAVYLLALLATRAWDAGDPARNLDRVTALARDLQGEQGSGHRFADNAETLLLIATSHYEPREDGYARLLERARALPEANRTAMALIHAQAMGSHLRFGYEVTYALDLKAMRDDNGADYPWLGFGLSWLMDAYARMAASGEAGEARDRIVEGLINGLTPDPDAFLGRRSAWLDAHGDEHDRFIALFDQHGPDLLRVFDRHRPRDHGYSPIALFFNFSQNVLKGVVVDALMRGAPWPFSLNDLFTGVPRDSERSALKAELARRLMAYARANPDVIGGRLAPVIVYDPVVGRRAFGSAVRVARQRVAATSGV